MGVAARFIASITMILFMQTALCGVCIGADLNQVRQRGVLLHLGVPYAKFITGAGDGMDVELIRAFAESLGVQYSYVETDWGHAIQDLVGRKVEHRGEDAKLSTAAPVKGDLFASGFTILPWRQKVVDFSDPTFISQIWLVARADSDINPVVPSSNMKEDIERVRLLMKGREVLTLPETCLDPNLYGLAQTGAKIICFRGRLNELAPAIINGEAEMTILDHPDALVALEKWPGKIKILGPISPPQQMGVAFPKTSPALRQAFNEFLRQCRKDGTYQRLVEKYFPSAPDYFPSFFAGK